MRKNRLLLLIMLISFGLLSTPLAAQAQDEALPNKLTYALGVNISTPILSLLKKQEVDSSSLVSPNVYGNVGYKKWHLRVGFGGNLNQKNNRSDLAANVSEELKYKYAFSLSVLKRSDLTEKISAYVGMYFWLQYYLNQTTYDSGFDLTTKYNEYSGYAAGPGVKLEYNLSKKISLFTEYCVLYRMDFQNVGRTFSAFPSESYKAHAATIRSVNFQHPVSIYLNYKF